MRELKSGLELADRYTLVGRLASGGTAEVWRASDRLAATDVALKIIVDPGLSPDILRREWQLSIRLMHAHIVRAFEFHEDASGAFYSLQFIDGPDVSVLAGARATDVLRPIAAVADALRYAHGKDVVHRDIKATNVLLDHNGSPYLIDFGVASTASAPVGGGSLIAASPEQLAGAPPAPADDIFALGGLVYELVSGRSPYSSASTAEDIRDKVPEPLQAANDEPVSPVVVDLVASMLAKDAASRPAAADIVATLAREGIHAGPADRRFVGSAAAVASEERIESDAVVQRRGPHARPTAAPQEESSAGGLNTTTVGLSLIHISEPTRLDARSRMPSSA